MVSLRLRDYDPLTSLAIVTRRLILQKARHHRLRGSDLLWVYGFRFYFTPLAGVLFAFPSRYYYAIGYFKYLALDRGRPGFRQDFSCPAVLRNRSTEASAFRIRGFHPLCPAFPKPFYYAGAFLLRGLRPTGPTTPLPGERFRLFRFRSPLLPESLLISIPGVLRWFSSPSLASAPYIFRRG